jgi:ubiquinone/menaquinone biosynthesis C-methylase UbiE
MTARVTRNRDGHPLFARFYARVSPSMERAGPAAHRHRLLAELHGDVIEVGAGTGANFGYYPTEVGRLHAVEPEAHLRAIAEREAQDRRVPIRVVDGVAEALPADDATFDAAVVSLVLCTVRDPSRAVAELHRVLKPGGELRFFEHVRANSPALAAGQRLLDTTIWPTFFGGCHTGRYTARAIQDGGFTIRSIERIRLPPMLAAAPHILGTATR